MIIPRQRTRPRPPKRPLAALAALLILAALSSCGQTGDLYLPDENERPRKQ